LSDLCPVRFFFKKGETPQHYLGIEPRTFGVAGYNSDPITLMILIDTERKNVGKIDTAK
jgi:hypothetical protein